MKVLWACLLLATLLILVQGKGGRGGGGRGGGRGGGSRGGYRGGSRGRSSGSSSSSRGYKNLKKAAIVGAVAYGTYQVGDHSSFSSSIIK